MQSAPQRHLLVRAPVRLPRGFVLGGYIIDGWLRDGGMASIYRAHRAQDERRVAIKLQLPHTALDLEICARFDQEAAAMRRMADVPNIVELYDAGALDDGRRYFAMEWLCGEDLEELLDVLRNRDQRLSVGEACRIGHEVAKGLAALHTQDLVHRDLKPANIMVATEDDGAVTLVDFGLVADLSEYRARCSHRGPRRETLMGTSAYMPPEQLAGAGPEPTADVFALGVVLYEALTGNCVPPEGWTPENLPTLESLRKNIPVPLAQFVRSCMSSDAQLRPRSAAEVADALGRFITPVGSANDGAAASSDRSLRPGRTEVVPRPEPAVLKQLSVRTGRTEVALTHEQALSISRRGAGSEPAEAAASLEAVKRSDEPEPGEEPTTEHVNPEYQREAQAQAQARSSGAGFEDDQPGEPDMATNPMLRPVSGAEDPVEAHQDPRCSSVTAEHRVRGCSSAAAPVGQPAPTSPRAVPIVGEPTETVEIEKRPAPISGPEPVARALDEPHASDRPRVAVDPSEDLRPSDSGQAVLSTSPHDSEDRSVDAIAIHDFERALRGQSRRRIWTVAGLIAATVVVLGLWSLAGSDGRGNEQAAPREPIVIVHSGDRSTPPPTTPNPVVATSLPPDDAVSNKRPATRGVTVNRAKKKRARARRASNRARCKQMRKNATLAKQERNWTGLLDHTEKPSCWAGSGENKLDRRRLRVEAYAETGDYARCVEEAGHEQDPRITDRVRWCKKRLEQEA